MIYHLDCDNKGIPGDAKKAHEAGLFKTKKIASLEDWRTTVDKMATTLTEEDIVIVDTLNMLASTIIASIRMRGTEGQSLDRVLKLMHEQGAYGADIKDTLPNIFRPLTNLANRGIRIITTVHQGLVDDPIASAAIKKRGPQLDKAIFAALNGRCTDMFRLGVAVDEEAGSLEPELRVLYLKQSIDDIVKTDIAREIRAGWEKGQLRNPTLAKLRAALQKDPEWLTVYGPPGVGKTTLVFSDAIEAEQAQRVQNDEPVKTKIKKGKIEE